MSAHDYFKEPDKFQATMEDIVYDPCQHGRPGLLDEIGHRYGHNIDTAA
jgi:hypothetical protein